MDHNPVEKMRRRMRCQRRTNPSRAGRTRLQWAAIIAAAIISFGQFGIHAGDVPLKISAKPLHGGRINPMLFGNFIELLDDLVPGMWAEMLNDRSFEGVTPAAKWVYFDGSPTICDRRWDASDNWSLDTNEPFNGSRCARLTGYDNRSTELTQSGLAVTKGESIRFSGYLRSDGTGYRVQAVIKSLLPNGRFVDLAAAELPAPAQSWTKCSAKLEVTGATDRATFELRLSGNGTVWADKLSLMPADNIDGWRKDVVEAIKACHPGIIRWGGSTIDPGRYHWKSGIGDRDRRIPFPNINWGRIDPNDVGIDEFCQFCALVAAEPLICVSVSDGAASAADLVQYCNGDPRTRWGARRAANGHPQPYHVKYWQLGNEISGNDDRYIKKCNLFIRAMRQSDAGIALVSSFPSQKVFDTIARDLAWVAPHHYTRDLNACEADFTKLSGMIARTSGCHHLQIAVTEWNFTAGDWGLLRGKMLTLEGALLNARYLNLLCRYSNVVTAACRSNMTNSYCSGIIGTSPSGLLKRPSYYVMKLYADHALPIPLSVSGAAAGLDVMACGDDQRKQVCLFAVNTQSKPRSLSLDLSELGNGIAPSSADTVCDTLDMRQPDVMNHWGTADRVRTVTLKLSGRQVTLPALSVSAIICSHKE